jgi:hypothetical protein
MVRHPVSDQDSIGEDMVLRKTLVALALLTVLAGPATTIQAASDSPIYPPPSYFIFPKSLVGGPTHVQALGPKNLYADGLLYGTRYSLSNITYEVDVFVSSDYADHYSSYVERGCINTADEFCKNYDWRPVDIAQPIDPDEWMGESDPYTGRSKLYVGLSYRNVYLQAVTDNTYGDVEVAQAATKILALDIVDRLFDRAKSFTMPHRKSHNSRPALLRLLNPVFVSWMKCNRSLLVVRKNLDKDLTKKGAIENLQKVTSKANGYCDSAFRFVANVGYIRVPDTTLYRTIGYLWKSLSDKLDAIGLLVADLLPMPQAGFTPSQWPNFYAVIRHKQKHISYLFNQDLYRSGQEATKFWYYLNHQA